VGIRHNSGFEERRLEQAALTEPKVTLARDEAVPKYRFEGSCTEVLDVGALRQ
jgi:hypothetical protein